jgi:hypothetical protein
VAYLDKDAILAAADLPAEDVDVPEWGGVVRVQGMSGQQRDAFEASIQKLGAGGTSELDPRDFRAKFATRVLVDEKGKRLFTNEEVQALSRKSARALQRVFEVGQRLSGMSDDDVASLEGNSEGQSDASTTA